MPKLVESVLKHVISASTLRSHGMLVRSLSITSPLAVKPLPPRMKIDEHDLIENFLKGSGPGGQKIVSSLPPDPLGHGYEMLTIRSQNKTSSAVQLLHKPTGIVIKCQATRSRIQNRKTARQLLAEKLEEREKGGESRTAIKAERVMKKKASSAKKSRRKYRALEEERRSGIGRKEGLVAVDGAESRGFDVDGGFGKT